MVREILMILFVTCSTLGSQLLIKDSVMRIARHVPVPSGLDWLMAVVLAPRIWMAVALQGIGFLVWVVVISRVKLGMAFAISGAFFYILIALLGWQLYGERLAPLQWTGIVLVSVGVLMISMLGYKA
jgi:multidrug transporter EmrE-like cation transporter